MINLLSVTTTPGRWGLFLSCLVAAGWTAAFLGQEEWKFYSTTAQTLVDLGAARLGCWMGALSLVSAFGAITGNLVGRLLGGALGVFTWSVFLVEAGAAGAPEDVGTYLALLLACAAAEWRVGTKIYARGRNGR